MHAMSTFRLQQENQRTIARARKRDEFLARLATILDQHLTAVELESLTADQIWLFEQRFQTLCAKFRVNQKLDKDE